MKIVPRIWFRNTQRLMTCPNISQTHRLFIKRNNDSSILENILRKTTR